jgi:hypothetical protein
VGGVDPGCGSPLFFLKGGVFLEQSFEQMVFEARNRFNDVFGGRTVFDLNAKGAAIWAVCWLGVLNKKIRKSGSIVEAKEYINNFNLIFEKLDRFYNNFEMKGESDDKALQVRQEERRLGVF